MSAPRKDIAPPLRVLLSEQSVAAIFDCAPSTISRMHRAGILPAPVLFGERQGTTRWRRAELVDWATAGAPDCRSIDWQWYPCTIPDYQTYLRRLRREAKALEREIRELSAIREGLAGDS